MLRAALRICIAILAVIGAFVTPAAAQKRFGDDIVVRVDSLPPGEMSHGYSDYRVSISNLSRTTSHEIRVAFPFTTFSNTPLHEVTRTVTVEQSSAVTVSLFAPLPVSGDGLGVAIDGRQQPDPVPLAFPNFSYGNTNMLLISQGAASLGFEGQAGSVLKDTQGRRSFATTLLNTPPPEWSTNWLSYSGYDGVVITANELRGMPEQVFSASWRYTECGGTLLVLGEWEAPQPWRSHKTEATPLPTYYPAFGEVIVGPEADLSSLTPDQWVYLQDAWQRTRQSLSFVADARSANETLPVANVTIPVRGLFVLILVFVIVIGPVNLFVLSKLKRKIWLLWTVPAVSLLTCLAVSAYTVLVEGWRGHSKTLAITVLDEVSHRAATVGLSAFYTPLTPGQGLHYSTETEVTPQWDHPYWPRSQSAYRTVDWTQDQHLETGWVVARTPAHFRFRRGEQRRERITAQREPDGSVTVVNGLGVLITTLWLTDSKGHLYHGKDILAGASATLRLQKSVPVSTATIGGMRNLFASSWIGFSAETTARQHLMPGSYVAGIASSPFVEEGLSGVFDRHVEAIVVGLMKEPVQ